jgi:ribosomal protein S1
MPSKSTLALHCKKAIEGPKISTEVTTISLTNVIVDVKNVSYLVFSHVLTIITWIKFTYPSSKYVHLAYF